MNRALGCLHCRVFKLWLCSDCQKPEWRQTIPYICWCNKYIGWCPVLQGLEAKLSWTMEVQLQPPQSSFIYSILLYSFLIRKRWPEPKTAYMKFCAWLFIYTPAFGTALMLRDANLYFVLYTRESSEKAQFKSASSGQQKWSTTLWSKALTWKYQADPTTEIKVSLLKNSARVEKDNTYSIMLLTCLVTCRVSGWPPQDEAIVWHCNHTGSQYNQKSNSTGGCI